MPLKPRLKKTKPKKCFSVPKGGFQVGHQNIFSGRIIIGFLFLVLTFSFLLFNFFAQKPEQLIATPSAQAQTKDMIAIRVFENPRHLSPVRWYQENVPHPGSPQSTVIDGYQAVRDGRSVYVAASNLSGNTLFTNIYLISYTEGAKPETQKILDEILKNWRFNSNLINAIGAGRRCSNDYNMTCTQDKDCPQDGVCLSIEPKDRLTRDVKRLADLQDIRKNLEDYNYERGSYPTLAAGTYLPKISFSVWPSWQKTLSQELGTDLPADPINQFYGCTDPYDPTTCWDNKSLAFNCPTNYYIYAYQSPTSAGDQAKVYTKLEYQDNPWYNDPSYPEDIPLNAEDLLSGSCNLNFGSNLNDYDNDEVNDSSDNCPTIPNGPSDPENQTDNDADGLGNICDPCPGDAENDKDNDGFCCGSLGNPNFGSKNTTKTDNCCAIYNPSQQENPLIPGVGLACSQCQDQDRDSFCSYATGGDDCNDNNQAINPAAPEIANGLDDNCNGKVDECESSLAIKVYQGTILDKAVPVLTLNKDAVTFYNYDGTGSSEMSDFDYNSDGRADFIEINQSNLFVYHNQNNNRLYLGLLHNIKGGGGGYAIFDLQGVPTDAQFTFKDDGDDIYTLNNLSWGWGGNTDGTMIELGPATRSWKIIITPTRLNSGDGIDGWRIPYDTGSSISYVGLDMNKAVTLEYNPNQQNLAVPCYTGPNGTLNVGICRAGTTFCQKAGQWGPCLNQILPQPEKCDATLIDSDCNGNPNNGCDVDGDGYCTASSGCTKPYGAIGNGCPKGCCDPNDNSAAVLPVELCDAAGIDQDCDGNPNNGCDQDKDGWCALNSGCTIPYGLAGNGCLYGCCDIDDNNANIIYPAVCQNFSNLNDQCKCATSYSYAVQSDWGQGTPYNLRPNQEWLEVNPIYTPYVWVASSGNNTVYRINTADDSVSGPFPVGANPSRTAVDLNNRVWVANRDSADVTYLNTDGTPIRICPVGSGPRAVAIDKNGFVWVGNWGDGTVYKLDPNNCNVLENINVGDSPYGGVIDGLGNLWISNPVGSRVDKINTETLAVSSVTVSGPYGITIDKNNNVWVASYSGQKVYKIDQSMTDIKEFLFSPGRDGRGVAVDKNNNVWVTHSNTDEVSSLDNNGNPRFTISSGGDQPVGITATTDTAGNSNIWVVNLNDARVCKFDLNGNLQICVVVGSVPYTYSDMAGYMLRAVTLRGGDWTTKFDTQVTNPNWQTLNLSWTENQPSDSEARVRVRTAANANDFDSDPNGLTIPWSGYFDDSPADLLTIPNFSPQRWLQIQVDLRLSWDDQSPTVDNLKIEGSFYYQ